ncbi:MAG: hypothetical protein KDC28_03125 [Saprospiraceae bacterium]|nr:hypothetical protein [Saprospiraceae bacterium]MCB9318173.1 hypothetical protein [Lewinellaceae bacterium]
MKSKKKLIFFEGDSTPDPDGGFMEGSCCPALDGFGTSAPLVLLYEMRLTINLAGDLCHGVWMDKSSILPSVCRSFIAEDAVSDGTGGNGACTIQSKVRL